MNERAIRNLFIVNSGKFNFDYEWILNERSARNQRMVSISPVVGPVVFGDRAKCQLAFCPTSRTVLRGCELTLKVSASPSIGSAYYWWWILSIKSPFNQMTSRSSREMICNTDSCGHMNQCYRPPVS